VCVRHRSRVRAVELERIFKGYVVGDGRDGGGDAAFVFAEVKQRTSADVTPALASRIGRLGREVGVRNRGNR
tara:strand:+ start:362 stop:577 length:216 start_codon:yes stop_codon:yes gene_type:complete